MGWSVSRSGRVGEQALVVAVSVIGQHTTGVATDVAVEVPADGVACGDLRTPAVNGAAASSGAYASGDIHFDETDCRKYAQ